MFGIIAILFLGPEKLPDAMVKIAKFFASFKKSVNEAKDTIEHEIHLSDLKKEALSYKEQLQNSVDKVKKDVNVLDDLNEGIEDIKESAKLDKPKKKAKAKTKAKKDSKDV
jgi:sec-independent protein translocase protein TatB